MSRPVTNRSITEWFRPKSNPTRGPNSLEQASRNELPNIRSATVDDKYPPSQTTEILDSTVSGPNKRQRLDGSADSSFYGSSAVNSTFESQGLTVNSLPSPASSTPHKTTGSPVEDQKSLEVQATSSYDHDPSTIVSAKGFSAGSSFSSLRSSQHSKRVIEHGEEVVKGSDSDTDGTESELEDLNAIMSKMKKNTNPAQAVPVSSTVTKPKNVLAALLSPRKKESKKEVSKRDYGAFDLVKLVEEKEQETAMEVRIAMAETDLNEARDMARLSSLQRTPRKDVIKAALIETDDDDQGKARRVMEALNRTEAFELMDVWYFFTNSLPTAPKISFPRIEHENKFLTTILNDPARREQAFSTGYIQRIVDTVRLPEQLLAWMINELCREPKHSLVNAYLDTLQRSLPPETHLLSPEKLRLQFQSVGADLSHANEPISHTSGCREAPLSPNLPSIVDALGQLSHRMSTKSKDVAAQFLLRALIDHNVRSDADLVVKINHALTLVLEAYSTGPESEKAHHRLASDLYAGVRLPILRYQLISALPRTTLSAHMFRRRLALAFTLENPKYLSRFLESHAITAHILVQLYNNPAYRITPSTDYLELKSRLLLLDAALDSGFSNFHFLEAGDSKAENEFNRGVDNLAIAIRDLMVKIVDVGAAHMRRTECKGAADRLLVRLEYAVRTKPKPGRRWLEDAASDQGAKSLQNWVAKESDRYMVANNSNDASEVLENRTKKTMIEEIIVKDGNCYAIDTSVGKSDVDEADSQLDSALEAQVRHATPTTPITPTTPRAPRVEVERPRTDGQDIRKRERMVESKKVVSKFRLLR